MKSALCRRLTGLALTFGAVAVPFTLSAADIALTEVQRSAPDFELELLDGERLDRAAMLGKVWVVNFWATWCPPCVEELPAMNTAWVTFEEAGVGMLAINVGETPDAIEGFLERVPIDFPVALGDGANALPDWDATVLPTTLIVDATGQVILEAAGPRDWDDPSLIERISALVAD